MRVLERGTAVMLRRPIEGLNLDAVHYIVMLGFRLTTKNCSGDVVLLSTNPGLTEPHFEVPMEDVASILASGK